MLGYMVKTSPGSYYSTCWEGNLRESSQASMPWAILPARKCVLTDSRALTCHPHVFILLYSRASTQGSVRTELLKAGGWACDHEIVRS